MDYKKMFKAIGVEQMLFVEADTNHPPTPDGVMVTSPVPNGKCIPIKLCFGIVYDAKNTPHKRPVQISGRPDLEPSIVYLDDLSEVFGKLENNNKGVEVNTLDIELFKVVRGVPYARLAQPREAGGQ
jgi:hypothetical protein